MSALVPGCRAASTRRTTIEGRCLAVCVLSTLAATAQAQTLPPAPAEVFPAVGAEVVRVEVVVTDKSRRPQADLAREDFAVFEDGKPQTLVQFEAFTRPITPASARPADSDSAAAVEPSPAPPRWVVLTVDDLHIDPGNLAHTQKALTRFLAEDVGPDDRVALVTTSGAAAHEVFTTDRAALRQAVSRLVVRQRGLDLIGVPRISEYQAELIVGGDREALQVAVQEINSQGMMDPDPEWTARLKASRVLEETVFSAQLTLERIEDVTRSLARLEGRKVLFLLSDGFLTGLTANSPLSYDVRRITDAGTRSGVVIYALDTRGLEAEGPGIASHMPILSTTYGMVMSMRRRSEEATRNAMNALAADTGGFLLDNSNDIARGLQQMLQDTETYYLLAYEPTNTKRDGRFRKIEVRVSGRSGLRVRARKGYFAPDERRAGPATSVPLMPAASPLRLSADFVSLDNGVTQVVVSGHVDVRGLRFTRSHDRYQATLETYAVVYDQIGAVAATLPTERVALNLTEAEHAQVLRGGLLYQKTVALAPGRYLVRFRGRGGDADMLLTLGSVEQTVEIADLASGRLTLSDVFLLRDGQAANAAPAGTPNEPVLQNVQARRRFRRGENLYLQLYAYNARRDAAGAANLVAQAEVLKGGVVRGSAAPEPMAAGAPGGPPVAHVSRIKLQPFEPGEYELRVTVTDRNADEKATRQTGFAVD